MPIYRYRARTPQGEMVTGTLEGDSATAVAQELSRGQVTPLDITEKSRGGGLQLARALKGLWQDRVRVEDLIFFSRQMATLLQAGVPLLQALAGQSQSTPNPRLREAIQGAREAVEAGRTLSEGFAQYPDVFNELMIQLIHLGETSGNLDLVFDRITGYLEQEKNIRDRTKQALRYPILVLVAIAVAFVILNVMVIPKFAGLFAGLDVELPLPTRILIGVSEFTRTYGWVLVLGLVGGFFAFRRYIRTLPGRRLWDRWKLRSPIMGDIFFKIAMARFTRGFATTTRSGVPLIEGLQVVSRSVGNRYVAERVAAIGEGIERGDTLYNTARRQDLFPLTVLQMIEVGEASGTVDEMMERVAEFYDREVSLKIDNLASLIEPILIAIIGGMVLVLALGIFLPMWDMARAFR